MRDLMQAIISDEPRHWDRNEPAQPDAIAQCISDLGIASLPLSYVEFLSLSNGGEGTLGVDPGWFQLWPCEELSEVQQLYHMTEELPGFLAIGSNGGGELLAFDTRNGEPWAVCMIPFITMEVAEAIQIAPDFDTFVTYLGIEASEAKLN